MQRAFRLHFNVGRHGRVPTRNTILLWVENFRATGSALKRKPPGGVWTVRTPENIEAVRQAIGRSPRRSALRHAAALRISDRSVSSGKGSPSKSYCSSSSTSTENVVSTLESKIKGKVTSHLLKMATPQEMAQCVSWFIETRSATQVQRNFRTTYGRKPPSRPTIYNWHRKFMETGSVLHQKGAGRPSTSVKDT